MTALRIRAGDTCPACGSDQVFEGVKQEAHAGDVFFDGCSQCLVIWERETREHPSREPCSNCAWLPGSKEVASGEIFTLIQRTIHGRGIFYCHRRVPFTLDLVSHEQSGFQHKPNDAGDRITNATVCAGWLRAKLKEKKFERENPDVLIVCEAHRTDDEAAP